MDDVTKFSVFGPLKGIFDTRQVVGPLLSEYCTLTLTVAILLIFESLKLLNNVTKITVTIFKFSVARSYVFQYNWALQWVFSNLMTEYMEL